MLVKRQKVINFRIQSHLVSLLFLFNLCVSDVWGPALASAVRFKYYVSFVDDYSKFTWIYLLKNKSDVFQKFCEFQQLVESRFDKNILAMQTDWEVNIKNSTPSFKRSVYPIFCLVHMLISRMDQLYVSTDI
jgi:hypothetical protein